VCWGCNFRRLQIGASCPPCQQARCVTRTRTAGFISSPCRAALVSLSLKVRREDGAKAAEPAASRDSDERWLRRQRNTRGRLIVKWCRDRGASPPPLAPLHTCTAISRLINCESCSLETLNHSFSVLSRAASLTTLTRVPPCLPNTGDGGVEVGVEAVWGGTARGGGGGSPFGL